MTRASTEGPDRATLIAFAAVVAFGGLNAIAVKATVAELDPLWGAGLRFLVAGLAMAALALIRRRAFPKGRALGGSMLYGIVGFAAAFGFIYTGLRDVQAGAAAVVLALSPLATYALAVAQRQESFYPRAVGGALVALVGVSVVFAEEVSFAAPVGSLALIFAGMVCLSEAGVIVKQIPRSDPFATNVVAMLTAAVARRRSSTRSSDQRCRHSRGHGSPLATSSFSDQSLCSACTCSASIGGRRRACRTRPCSCHS